MARPEISIQTSSRGSDENRRNLNPVVRRFISFVNFQRKEKNHEKKEPKEATTEKITTIKAENLIPILEWAYGKKEWNLEGKDWKEEKWSFLHPEQKAKNEWTPEVKDTYDILKTIMKWSSDEKTRKHLDPAPGVPVFDENGKEIDTIPPDWNNADNVDCSIADLAKYYFNAGEPQKITPMVSINKLNKPVGVVTIRWKGDPYNPERRIAGIERLIVDPRLRGYGKGTELVCEAIEYILEHKAYETEKGEKIWASEIRIWVMTDKQASPWDNNFRFFRKFGFQPVPYYPQWKEYAEKRGFETKGRDAVWMQLKPSWYFRAREEHKFEKCGKIKID